MTSHRWLLLMWAIFCGVLPSGCAALKLPAESATAAASPSPPPVLEPTGNIDPFAGISRALAPESAKDKASTVDGQIALARLCERRGENDQAEQMYRAMLAKAPQDGRLHHRLGVLAIRKGNFPVAEEHLRKAQEILPSNPDVFSDLGYCYYLQQRLPDAERALNQATQISADHPAATNNLALVVGAQGHFKEALTLFKRVNSEAEAYANMGYVLAQHGDPAQAQEMYARALTLRKDLKAAAQAMVQIEERSRTSDQDKNQRRGPTAVNESENILAQR